MSGAAEVSGMTAPARARRSAPERGGPSARIGPVQRTRVAYLDNVKVILVAAIIAAHGVAA